MLLLPVFLQSMYAIIAAELNEFVTSEPKGKLVIGKSSPVFINLDNFKNGYVEVMRQLQYVADKVEQDIY